MVTTTLTGSFKEEITQAFNVFDEKRTGKITINSLKLLIRALGFRVTRNQVFRDTIEAKRRLGRNYLGDKDENDNDDYDIDLDLIYEIIESKYNKDYDPNAEMKINFRLFDAGNKGYIEVSDLKRVIAELNAGCSEMGVEPIPEMREDQLQAMIDEFDGDLDSVINFAEFKRIMKHT
jgi:Ca2+-binding EF-hand superfamily protein